MKLEIQANPFDSRSILILLTLVLLLGCGEQKYCSNARLVNENDADIAVVFYSAIALSADDAGGETVTLSVEAGGSSTWNDVNCDWEGTYLSFDRFDSIAVMKDQSEVIFYPEDSGPKSIFNVEDNWDLVSSDAGHKTFEFTFTSDYFE